MSNYHYNIGIKVLIDSEVVDFNFKVPRGTLVVQILDDLEATLKVHPTIIATINDFGEIEKIENHYSTIDYLVQRYGTEYYVGGTTIVTFSYQGYVVDLEVPEATPFAATFRTACKSFSLKTREAAIKRQDGQIMDYEVFNRPTAFVFNAWGSYYEIVPRTKGDALPKKEPPEEISEEEPIPKEEEGEILKEGIKAPELLPSTEEEQPEQPQPFEKIEAEQKVEETVKSSLLRLEEKLLEREEKVEGVPGEAKRKKQIPTEVTSSMGDEEEKTPPPQEMLEEKRGEIPEKEYPWIKDSPPTEESTNQLSAERTSGRTEEEKLLEELADFAIEEETTTAEKARAIEDAIEAAGKVEPEIEEPPTEEIARMPAPTRPTSEELEEERTREEQPSLPERAAESEETEDFSLAERLRRTEMESKREMESTPRQTTQRTTDIEYFKKMNPKKVFPLTVRIAPSPQQIPEKEFEGTTHIETPLVVESTEKNIPVKIIPIFPGCQVTPREVTVDIKTSKLLTVKFYITPLIDRGKVSSKVEFWHMDKKVLQVDTPSSVVNKFWAKVTGITGAITGVVPGLLKLFNVDVNQGLSAGVQSILPTINLTSKTFLWIEIGLLVGLGGVTVGLLFLFKPVRDLIKRTFYPTTPIHR